MCGRSNDGAAHNTHHKQPIIFYIRIFALIYRALNRREKVIFLFLHIYVEAIDI